MKLCLTHRGSKEKTFFDTQTIDHFRCNEDIPDCVEVVRIDGIVISVEDSIKSITEQLLKCIRHHEPEPLPQKISSTTR